MKRLRLVKVIVQPVFVVDDGTTLTEQIAQPASVNPADWADYPSALAASTAQAEMQLNYVPIPGLEKPVDDTPTIPNDDTLADLETRLE